MERKPLSGKRILITRTRQQASGLARQLEELGAEAILIPTIELAPPLSFEALDAALASLGSFEWILFTSANAVQVFCERAKHMGVLPSACRQIAVIGPATARVAKECGLRVDLVPERFVAESLLEALQPHARGKRMLLVRATDARDVLPDGLQEAGADLTIAEAYRNVIPEGSVLELRDLLGRNERIPHAITFTSSSTASNFFALLAAAGLALPPGVVLASIGPVTSQTLQDLGYSAATEAEQPTIESLVQALQQHFSLATRG